MKRYALYLLAPMLGLGLTFASLAKATPETSRRRRALTLQRDGNYAEAYEGFRELACDPRTDPDLVGSDLTHAVGCLRRLNRNTETDAVREAAVAAHPANWRLLRAAAQSLFGDVHYGFISVEPTPSRRTVCIVQRNATETGNELHGERFWCAGEPLEYAGLALPSGSYAPPISAPTVPTS